MSIFLGKTALRLIYKEVSIVTLNATTAALANQFLVVCPDRQARLLLITNTTDVDVVFTAVSGACTEAELAAAAYRLKLFEMPAGSSLNFETGGINDMMLDPATKIFVYRPGVVAATTGKIRMLIYG